MKKRTVVGIYTISNKINNKLYVGSSANISKRWYEHKYQLRSNTHHSILLQRAWNKYGEENFEFKVIIVCEKFELLRYEQELINRYNSDYNSCRVSGSPLGFKHPPSFGKAVRERQLGRKASEESKLRMSKGRKGKKPWTFGKHHSEETKRKISLSNTGKVRDRDSVERMRQTKLGKSTQRIVYPGFISPEGIEYRNITELVKFCLEHNLKYSGMNRLYRKERNIYKGWISI